MFRSVGVYLGHWVSATDRRLSRARPGRTGLPIRLPAGCQRWLAPDARRFEIQHEVQRTQADLTAIMQETLNISGFVLMKAFAREAWEAGFASYVE